MVSVKGKHASLTFGSSPRIYLEVKSSLFQEEAIWIIGCNVPLQPYLLRNTTSQSSCQGSSHLTLTHMHAYLLLSKSCPFLHLRTRHFKKIFPLFSHHHRQSITKSCQFYLPSSSRIHLRLFFFHSNSPRMESPCSPLLVFE